MAVQAVGLLAGALQLGTIATTFLEIGTGLVLSYAARQRQKAASRVQPAGIRSQFTGRGETQPQTLMLGEYATRGNAVAPYYSNGQSGSVPNAYRYQIIDLADAPVTGLKKIILGDKEFVWPDDFNAGTQDFRTVKSSVHDGRYEDRFYAKFYDGTQTAADPQMVSRFGGHAERPWTTDHIGTGVPYVVLAYAYNGDDLWQGEPQPIFVVEGAKLYDWRLDSTNGGTGAHRWDDTTTWEYSDNPFVQAYNFMRGYTMPDGEVFGLGADESDLPVDYWTAAANKADSEGFATGYEVRIGNASYGGDTVLDIIDELLLAADGAVCDIGGTWLVRCTTDDIPVATITDSVVLMDRAQDFDPFSDQRDVFNIIRGTHPSPDVGYQAREIGPYEDATSITQLGERRATTVPFNAAIDYQQVQKLLQRALTNAGRARKNTLAVTPYFCNVMPMDSVFFTSDRHGYSAKQMECTRLVIEARTLVPFWQLKELDPTNYTGPGTSVITAPSHERLTLAPATLSGFAVAPVTVVEADGLIRVGGLQPSWTVQTGLTGVDWQVRVTGTTDTAFSGRFDADQAQDGEGLVIAGIKALVDYEVRAKPVIANIRTDWTAWTAVTAPAVYVQQEDIAPLAVVASSFDQSGRSSEYLDEDLRDERFYTADTGSFTLERTSVSGEALGVLSLPDSGASSVSSGWMPCEKGASYTTAVRAWLFSDDGANNAGTVHVYAELTNREPDGDIEIANIRQVSIAMTADDDDTSVQTGGFTASSSEVVFRLVFEREALGTQRGRFAEPRVWRLQTRDLQAAEAKTEFTRIVTGTAGETVFPATGSWLNIASVVADKKTEADMDLMASFDYSCASDNKCRFTEDGTLVGEEFFLPSTGGTRTPVSRFETDDTTGTGDTTYRLQVQADTVANTLTLWPRTLKAMHTGS